MRMALSEALRGDLDAVEDGALATLPRLDLSGRQLVRAEPSRHAEGVCSSESLASGSRLCMP